MMMMMKHFSLQTISYLHFSRFSAFALNSPRSPKRLLKRLRQKCRFAASITPLALNCKKASVFLLCTRGLQRRKKSFQSSSLRNETNTRRCASAGAKWKIKNEGFVFILHSSQSAKMKEERAFPLHGLMLRARLERINNAKNSRSNRNRFTMGKSFPLLLSTFRGLF